MSDESNVRQARNAMTLIIEGVMRQADRGTDANGVLHNLIQALAEELGDWGENVGLNVTVEAV